MSERLTDPEVPDEPELLASQVKLKAMADEILSYRPIGSVWQFHEVFVSYEGIEARDALKGEAVGEILLGEEDSLLWPIHGSRGLDADSFTVGQSQLKGMSLRAWGTQDEKVRFFKNSNGEQDYKVYPGEIDWQRSLFIHFQYENADGGIADEIISIATSSYEAGKLPSISRGVNAFIFADQGYDGHNQVYLENNTEEISQRLLLFIGDYFEVAKNSPEN